MESTQVAKAATPPPVSPAESVSNEGPWPGVGIAWPQPVPLACGAGAAAERGLFYLGRKGKG